MSAFSKIFMALSMICYLATSSIAAAHALPMMGGMGSSDRIALNAKKPVSEAVKQVEMIETMMACHQDANVSAEAAKISGICKIFCSAIGHALLSVDVVELASKFQITSPSSKVYKLATRQLTVEHQPPRQPSDS